MAVLMRGAEVSAGMRETLLAELAELRARGVEPRLAILRVGAREDDLAYERGVLKRFAGLGMEARVYELPEGIAQGKLEAEFARLNEDPLTHGILLFRPLPPGLNDGPLRRAIDPRKDVDGMSPINTAQLFAGEAGAGQIPCTPGAVMEMLAHYGVELAGKKATVVGRSMVAGRPLAMLLLAAHATVTIAHTKSVDLPGLCRGADVLVAAAGRAGLIGADCVTERSVVVDVGMNLGPDGKLCGDVDFAAVLPVAAMLSPVPGGVGAVTTSVLAKNTLRAARLLNANMIE